MIQPVFLVVDDDSQVREILVQYLKSFGYENILEAKNGKVALNYLHDYAQVIDIVISDWEMPEVDGLTLLKSIRKDTLRRNIKFVMVTSQGSKERIKITKAAQARVDAYIVKPFRADVLKEKIDIVISGKQDPSAAGFEAALKAMDEIDGKKKKKNSEIIIDSKGRVAAPAATLIMKREKKDKKVGDVYIDARKKSNKGQTEVMDVEASGKGWVKEKAAAFDLNNLPKEFDVGSMNIELILNLARAYHKVKWFDKAHRLCNEANKIFPGHVEVMYHLGLTLFLMGRLEEAKIHLSQAVALEPYHVAAQTLLSQIKDKQSA